MRRRNPPRLRNSEGDGVAWGLAGVIRGRDGAFVGRKGGETWTSKRSGKIESNGIGVLFL